MLRPPALRLPLSALAATLVLLAAVPAPAAAHSGHTDIFFGDEAVYTVAWNADGTRFAAGTSTGNITIYDGIAHTELLKWHAHDGPINQIAFAPNGTEMVSASGAYENASTERDIKVWTLPFAGQPTLRLTLTGHYDWVPTVAYSPDGRYIASASGIDDHVNITNAFGEVFVWDAVRGGQPLWKASPLDSYPARLAWSPDGSEIATLGHLSDIWLLNLTTKEMLRISPSYRDPVGHASHGWAVAWSPDSRYVVGGFSRDLNQDGATDKGPVVVFDTKLLDSDGYAHLDRDAYLHEKPAEWVSWDSSGQYIASCSGADVLGADGTPGSDGVVDVGEVIIYDALAEPGKLKELHTFRGGFSFCSSVEWRPGNLTVVAGNADGSVRLYILDEDGDGCWLWDDAAPYDPAVCAVPQGTGDAPAGGDLGMLLLAAGGVGVAGAGVWIVRERARDRARAEAEERSRQSHRRVGRARGSGNGKRARRNGRRGAGR